MSVGKVVRWVVVLAVLGAGSWYGYQKWNTKDEAPKFRTAKIEKGPLIATVAATGILNPVVSVSVSSQVSGQVKETFVDFNAEVKKGQLIARIDPEQIAYRLRQSQADLDAARASIGTQQANVAVQRAELARAEANLAEAKRDFDRKTALVQKNFISPSEAEKAEAVFKAQAAGLEAVRAQLGVALANARNSEAVVKQREAQVAQAKIDLERTAIRSPVNGVVVKRTVEPGQTVAASLQAPELFVIAQNLADMQVDAAIDESDVGRLRVGQTASFTVDAFPGRTFTGAIRQVRKAAQTVSNVVTYTVVISAANPDLILLPGMTASVRVTTDRRDAALKVANSALRFRPPGVNEDGSAASGAAAGKDGSPAPGGGAAPGAGGPGGGRGQLAAMRERLVVELKLDASQQASLDAIFAGMREKFMALRDMAEADRAKASERNRAEIREKITAILNETQRKRYAEIVAETAGRAPARGRVWVAGADGKPQAVQVRLGLTDGTTTELIGSDLKEGQEVLVGVQLPPGKPAAAAPAGAPRGPRLPF
ncbi:MAG: HlyD family secretion protein [Burkholderiales bacterium]|nr:HlyD family secretion protein [Burkholderiales bacterium]